MDAAEHDVLAPAGYQRALAFREVGPNGPRLSGDRRHVTGSEVVGSFRHRGLKALYEGRTARRVAPEHERKLRDILAALDQSGGPSGMDLPGFRLHPLSGTMKG